MLLPCHWVLGTLQSRNQLPLTSLWGAVVVDAYGKKAELAAEEVRIAQHDAVCSDSSETLCITELN